MLNKKTIILISASAVAIIAALLTALLIIKPFKHNNKTSSKTETTISENSSEASKTDSSSEEIQSSQPEESVPVVTDNGIRLVFSSPTSKTVNTTEPTLSFAGTSDPEAALTVNGVELERGENGIFSKTVNLNVGKNTFKFVHKAETVVYTVNYRYVVISNYQPSTKQTYSSNSTFAVTVTARKGSSVTASFNGQTITLSPLNGQNNENDNSNTFINFGGSFQLPGGHYSDLNLGKITYTATHNGKSESFKSGDVICKRPDFIVNYDPNATPLGGRYINVGSGIIAEIVGYEAETFDPRSTNDWSRPTNNYLPQGTVDYCAEGSVYYKSSSEQKEYAVLRCGRQVYISRKDKPRKTVTQITKKYAGTLPDHNEIGISSFENGTQHTTLTLDTMWKAPFYFDILPQSYKNPAKQDYVISDANYNYIDITFCYATVLTGEIVIPEDNPLFSSANIIKGQSDHTLRLHLKKQGAFYGWNAYYNAQNQLVFEFLNPAKVTAAENEYKTDLTGVKILIDVGHGGIDIGAPGFDSKNHNEAIQNLVLANKIKAELQSIGATVYMTRTDNSTSSTDDKIKMLKSIKPDYCIAIHHNSNPSSSPNGFDSYYFHPFSKKAAEFVNMHTANTGIYKSSDLGWHYYFTARTAVCPVVLTENGFISNSYDYGNIINDSKNVLKAKAIVKGVAEYFNSIQQNS